MDELPRERWHERRRTAWYGELYLWPLFPFVVLAVVFMACELIASWRIDQVRDAQQRLAPAQQVGDAIPK